MRHSKYPWSLQLGLPISSYSPGNWDLFRKGLLRTSSRSRLAIGNCFSLVIYQPFTNLRGLYIDMRKHIRTCKNGGYTGT